MSIVKRNSVAAEKGVLGPTEIHSFWSDDVFEFLVGEKQQSFRVHVAAFKRVSAPLASMMMNGSMQESLSKQAILESVDPDAFSLLTEYAYTGWYTHLLAGSRKQIKNPDAQGNPLESGGFYCRACGTTISQSGRLKLFPNLTVTPPPLTSRCSRCNTRVDGNGKITLFPSAKHGHSELSKMNEEYNKGISLFGMSCNCKNCRFNAAQMGTLRLQRDGQTDASKQDEIAFLSRQYPAKGMSHTELCNFFDQNSHRFKLFESLYLHAKLYVLADMYLIEPLKELSLHRLYRDLKATEPRGKGAAGFIELLLYSYDNTIVTETKDGLCKRSDLRDLVMAYASANAKALSQHAGFKSMLAEGGDWTVDFLDQVVRKI